MEVGGERRGRNEGLPEGWARWKPGGDGRAKNRRRASEGPDGRPEGPAGPGRPGQEVIIFHRFVFIVFSSFFYHFPLGPDGRTAGRKAGEPKIAKMTTVTGNHHFLSCFHHFPLHFLAGLHFPLHVFIIFLFIFWPAFISSSFSGRPSFSSSFVHHFHLHFLASLRFPLHFFIIILFIFWPAFIFLFIFWPAFIFLFISSSVSSSFSGRPSFSSSFFHHYSLHFLAGLHFPLHFLAGLRFPLHFLSFSSSFSGRPSFSSSFSGRPSFSSSFFLHFLLKPSFFFISYYGLHVLFISSLIEDRSELSRAHAFYV